MDLLKRKLKKKRSDYLARKNKVNAKIKASKPDFRMILSKSNLYTGAQLIDSDSKVLANITDKGQKTKTKTERAKMAGLDFAKLIKKQKVEQVVDRNGHRYHGRVKSFVEGVREGGIQC